MTRLNDHADALRLDGLLNGLCYLHREALLYLQPPGKDVHQTRNLTQPNHLTVWNISHVHFAEKWQHVVLAQAEHFNILDDDHLVIGHIKKYTLENLIRALPLAFGQIFERFLHSLRRLEQAIALRIFSQTHQNLMHQVGSAGGGQRKWFIDLLHSVARS